MPEVRNKSGVPHRYYDYARKAYVSMGSWGGQGRAPLRSSSRSVRPIPSKMELVLPTPEPEPVEVAAEVPEEVTAEVPEEVAAEVPEEVTAEVPEDFTEQAVDRAQRGGSRRSASSEEA